jgi:hypothetical protein
MKKVLVFTILIAVLISSCNKSGSSTHNSPYYIKATIDGKTRTFGVNAVSLKTGPGSPAFITITATTGAGVSPETMAISINNVPHPYIPITTGVYDELIKDDYTIDAVYNPGSASVLWSAGVTANPDHPLHMIITTFDDKVIRGTFNGSFYYTDAATGEYSKNNKFITNGEFYVKAPAN